MLRGGEHLDFTDGIASGRSTYAPAEIGHRTATVAHLGNIAMLQSRTLHWDPQAEHIKGDDEANQMLSREQREPWTIDNVNRWLERRT